VLLLLQLQIPGRKNIVKQLQWASRFLFTKTLEKKLTLWENICWYETFLYYVSCNRYILLSWRQNVICENLVHHLPVTFSVRSAVGCVVHAWWDPSRRRLSLWNWCSKVHKRTAAIYRTFRSRNADLLIRAYLTYVRLLVEHDSNLVAVYC